MTVLANVRQREGETLQAYFKRFNAGATGVKGATDETLKNIPIAGLQIGTDFWKHIHRRSPSSLGDFYEQAESFNFVEESLIDNRKFESRETSKGKSSKRRENFFSHTYRKERKVYQVEKRE